MSIPTPYQMVHDRNVPSILIVDDMESNISLFEEVMSGNNIKIQSALNVDDAMEIMRTSYVSMACIDIQMPKKDGFDLVAEMKADPTTAGIPFVIITGMEYDYSTILKSFELGALDYIVKPIANSLSRGKLTALFQLFRRMMDERDVIEEIKTIASNVKKEDLNPVASSSLSIIQEFINQGRI